jgi:23S rRNA pseudouridine1911/1915/1917 synthase
VILFQDERYLAVEKPSGVSMATPRGEEDGELVSRFLEACGQGAAKSSGELFLLHRLDVGTSGIVLLARSREAHRRASLLFQSRKVEKTYRAIAWGHPVPARGTLDAPLAMDRGDRRRMKVHPAGKAAATDYRTLARLPGVAHLELAPRTGRTHQIRVHLADKGHPIVGDDLYGGARWRGIRDTRLRHVLSGVDRLLLHACRLEFDDPFTGARARIESPEPPEFDAVLRAAAGARSRLSLESR